MRLSAAVITVVLASHTVDAHGTEQAWLELVGDGLDATLNGEYPFRRCFRRAAVAHHVPENLLIAVARGESNFDPAAVSSANAIGVMQIQWPGTARHLGFRSERQLFDACRNIDAGARYLNELYERFDRNWHRALAAYNFGPSRIGDGKLPDRAAWYSRYILRHLHHLRELDAGEPRPLVSVEADNNAAAAGSFAILQFEQHWQLENLLRWIEPKLTEFRLEWRRSPAGQHEMRLLYADATERRAAESALVSILGFNPNNPR